MTTSPSLCRERVWHDCPRIATTLGESGDHESTRPAVLLLAAAPLDYREQAEQQVTQIVELAEAESTGEPYHVVDHG